MATKDDGQEPGQTGDGPERWRAVLPTQIDLILDPEAGLTGAAVHPPRGEWGPDGPEFLYRQGHILVRDEDVERVRRIINGRPVGEGRLADARLDRNLNGLTLFELAADQPVIEALQIIDRRLGRGVATPDHVFYLCMHSGCPATEPEEVPEEAKPHPPERDEPPCNGTGTLISIVDSGLAIDPPLTQEWMDGVEGDAEPTYDAAGKIRSYAGHGTFCAGVARTVARYADVFVEKAFEKAGAAFENDLVTQIGEALDRAPDVISLSFGTNTRGDFASLGFDVLKRRLDELKGVILVCAAGNDNTRKPFWPAAFPWTVSVGALTQDGKQRAHFSNYGGWVDVYAPGEGLVNAFATGDFVCVESPNEGDPRKFAGMARWSGTSFSTPMVAGLIAARMSVTGENGRQAAAALLRRAQAQAIPGLGAVLYPDQACDDDPRSCGCREQSSDDDTK